jgi:hypothetical protein
VFSLTSKNITIRPDIQTVDGVLILDLMVGSQHIGLLYYDPKNYPRYPWRGHTILFGRPAIQPCDNPTQAIDQIAKLFTDRSAQITESPGFRKGMEDAKAVKAEKTFKEHEVVIFVEPVDSVAPIGLTGTIVSVHSAGKYTVELSDRPGTVIDAPASALDNPAKYSKIRDAVATEINAGGAPDDLNVLMATYAFTNRDLFVVAGMLLREVEAKS